MPCSKALAVECANVSAADAQLSDPAALQSISAADAQLFPWLGQDSADLPAGNLADEKLALLEKDVAELSGRGAMSSITSKAFEAAGARVTSAALQDFERKVDELERMQMSFLCDQLATFRQEFVDMQAEFSTSRAMLAEEQASRECAIQALHQEMKAQRDGTHLKEALNSQSSSNQKLKRDLEKISQRCRASGYPFTEVEKSDETLVRPSTASVQTGSSAIDLEFKAQLQETLRVLQSEAKQHSTEISQLVAQCSSHAAALEAERGCRQQGSLDLTEQVRSAMEKIQNEQAQRFSEDAELRQAGTTMLAEMLRESLDEARRRQEDDSSQTAQAINNLAKGSNEEVRTRDAEIAQLRQLISDVREPLSRLDNSVLRLDGEQKEHENALLRLDAEQQEHANAFLEFSESFVHLRSTLDEQHLAQNTIRTQEIRKVVEEQCSSQLQELTSLGGRVDECTRLGQKAEDCWNLVARLQDVIVAEQTDHAKVHSQVLSKLELEVQAREEGDGSLARSMQNAGEALEEAFEEALRKHLAQPTRELENKIHERTASIALKTEVSENLSQLRDAITAEQTHRAKLRADVQTWLKQEASNREEADMSLAQSVHQASKAVEDALLWQDTIEKQVQDSRALSADLEMVRQALPKVVEVFRQEHAQLREEVCDAIHQATLEPECWKNAVVPIQAMASGTTAGSQPIHRV